MIPDVYSTWIKILLMLITVISFKGYAFINIEILRKNSESDWNHSAKLLFNQQTGNTDKVTAKGSTLNPYIDEIHEYILMANISYGESSNQKDTKNGNIQFRYTRNIYEFTF